MPHLSDATRGRLLLLTKQAGVNSVTLGVFSWSSSNRSPGHGTSVGRAR